MEFRVLGPVRVLADGRLVPLKERKQRLVLALLLLDVNQLVPIDRLVDLLWLRDPPSSARRIVQAHVSRLRTTIEALDGGDAHLVRHGACYMLDCDPGRIDVHMFRALLDQARRTGDDRVKKAILHEALALWHGPALADAATDQLRGELCGGLDEARLVALEDRLDVELRLGNHASALDELTDLHARHPSRTRVAAQLMVALHRSGRSPEALRVYLRTTAWLREEFGVDPTAELDRLYTAILRADPAIDVPPEPAAAPQEPAAPPMDSVPPGPHDRRDVSGHGAGSGRSATRGTSRAQETSRPRRTVREKADFCADAELRRELELIAARRGVGAHALARQIIGEWVAAQRRPAPAPDNLVELTRHLDAARRVAATLARQTDPVADGAVAAGGSGTAVT